jgi:hypothetical protein
MAPGVKNAAHFARQLAENGCEVLVPTLIDRADTWSGAPGIRMTNQPHREWIYRMAFEVGRHIIGYEVQKVLAGIDWFMEENTRRPAPIGVIGYAEGGLLALYSAAIDPRIQAAAVSGYFQSRQELWQEPIYRDVWGLLREFGDAELAGLIAPRPLIVEASRGVEIEGPPRESNDRKGAAPLGKLTTPPLDSVRAEVERARPYFQTGHELQPSVSGDGRGAPGSPAALEAFLKALGVQGGLRPSGQAPEDQRRGFDPTARLHRQFNELVEYTQKMVRDSPARRAEFWSKADASSPQRWRQSTRFYRDYVWNEVIGRMPGSGSRSARRSSSAVSPVRSATC